MEPPGWTEVRPLRPFLALALVMGLGAQSGASLETMLELCSNPNRSAAEALQSCKALAAQDRLPAEQQALVWQNVGQAALELDRNGEAAQAYGRALGLLPDLVTAFLGRAEARAALGLTAPARADYDAAIARAPEVAEAWFARGVLSLSTDAPEDAVADFTKAAELDPDWTPPLFNRGIAELARGDADAAARDFSAVIALEPADAGAHLNRARARAILEDPAAAADFDRAVELAPEWSDALLARGHYREEQGATEAANEDFLRAYQLGASNPWLIERVRQISKG